MLNSALTHEDVWERDFSLLHSIQTGSWIHSASYPMKAVLSFRGLKRSGREADHYRGHDYSSCTFIPSYTFNTTSVHFLFHLHY
jgi:hypothetical protein